MGLTDGVLGREDGRNAEARVRFVGFSEREAGRESLFSSPKLQRKGVTGPSGKFYKFRQQGRPTNSKSQWLPVRATEDVEYFEEREAFEVRRDRP